MMPRTIGGGSMYDRMKKTGYITSRNHPMAAAMNDAPMGGDPNGDDQSTQAPPNLRDSTGPQSCGDCQYFDTAPDTGGRCTQFNDYSVTANQVCDAWAAMEEGGNENGETTGTGPEQGQQ